MRRFVFFIAILFFLQCSDDNFHRLNVDDIQLSDSSLSFGQAVAEDIKDIIQSLHKNGIDYSDADASNEFKERFLDDLQNHTHSVTRTGTKNIKLELTTEEFINGYRNLTKKQIDFVFRIINECTMCSSYVDLMNRLVVVSNDIIRELPEFQRERLQNIVAVLYFGAKEMLYLESNGFLVSTPSTSVKRIKTRSEFDSSTCTQFLTTIWTIAVGEPTPAGEIVAAVTTVLIGVVWYYEVVVCKKESSVPDADDYRYCQEMFENCESPLPDGCSKCLEYCLTQGVWPPYSTHRCS